MVVKSQLTQIIKNDKNKWETRQMRIKSVIEKLRKSGKPGQNMINHLVNRNSEFTNTNIKDLDNQNTVTGIVNVIRRVLKFKKVKNKSINNSNRGSARSKSSPIPTPTPTRSRS
jgi:hypothetical protein